MPVRRRLQPKDEIGYSFVKKRVDRQWFPNPKFPECLRAVQPKIEQRLVVPGHGGDLD
jgi:hypothetical protein